MDDVFYTPGEWLICGWCLRPLAEMLVPHVSPEPFKVMAVRWTNVHDPFRVFGQVQFQFERDGRFPEGDVAQHYMSCPHCPDRPLAFGLGNFSMRFIDIGEEIS